MHQTRTCTPPNCRAEERCVSDPVCANNPPVADADGPYTVLENHAIQLDGTGSYDTDGSIASYTWSGQCAPYLDDVHKSRPTFTAPEVSSDTNYACTLIVADDDGATDSDTTTITVKNCACTPWTNQGCGSNGCSSIQMYQTRTCTPSGCDTESQCVLDVINCDTQPPTTQDNTTPQWTGTDQTIKFSCSDPMPGSGCDKIRYCVDSTGTCTPGNEADISSGTYTIDVTCPEGNICVNYIRYRSKDKAGNWENIKTNQIRIDKQPPSASVLINNGNLYTNSPQVTLALSYSDGSGSGINDCRYSNDDITWSAWEACTATKTWTLSGGDGLKTVYYEVRDNAGNTNKTTDTITLDTSPPTPSISLSVPAWTNKTKFNVTWSVTENETGIKNTDILYKVTYSNATLIKDWTVWINHAQATGTKEFGDGVPLTPENNKTYYFIVNATDLAGNTGVSPAVNTTVDLENPVPSTEAYDQDGNPITESVVSPEKATSITLKSSSRDYVSGIQNNIIKYWVTHETLTYHEKDCGSGEPFGGESSCSTNPIPYKEETIIKYRVEATDRAGNTNATNFFFILTHPLANFIGKTVHISLGTSQFAKIQLRNIQPYPDNITVSLSDYEPAFFADTQEAEISENKRQLKAELNPMEEKTFYIRILSSTPNTYYLNLQATSERDPDLTDTDSIKILITYPESFPGLDNFSALLLVLLSVIIFARAKPV